MQELNLQVQFYQLDVGEKTRSRNKNLYVQGIDSA